MKKAEAKYRLVFVRGPEDGRVEMEDSYERVIQGRYGTYEVTGTDKGVVYYVWKPSPLSEPAVEQEQPTEESE